MTIDEYLSHYRPNVGVVLFNRDGRVWIGRRIGDSTNGVSVPEIDRWRWQLPQGGIDRDEDIVKAAFRELAEETGVSSARLLAMTPGWLAYDFPAGYKKKNWRGQRQKWAAMLFEGRDSEVELDAHGAQEFDAWRWCELEEAPALIVPFKRQVYDELVLAFAPLRDFIRARA